MTTIEQTLKDPCPVCGHVGLLELFAQDESVVVKGETFQVQRKAVRCKNCDETFSTPELPDHLADAYGQYRVAHGLLTPAEIKAWREGLSLRQGDLAVLLGWSPATISRYENGALQDRVLRVAMTPSGFSALVDAAQLPADLKARLRAEADEQLGSVGQLVDVVAHRSLHGLADASWRKVTEAVLFLTNGGGTSRTKLNKLLFYVDFVHAKYFDAPVTGLDYIRLQHGPVPAHYELLFATMQENGLIDIQETLFGEHVGYQHVARKGCDSSVFTNTELQALLRVRTEFEQVSASAISERSHTEAAWLTAANGGPVSLAHAKTLTLEL
jgi:putative zinc finger/helix-turn-helix YgiT family protein